MRIESITEKIRVSLAHSLEEFQNIRELRKVLSPRDKVILTTVGTAIFLAGVGLQIDQAKAFGIGMVVSTNLE